MKYDPVTRSTTSEMFMSGGEGAQDQQGIWVGFWKVRRHVVFDPSIQPANPNFRLLYFVEGHALCVRERAVEQKEVITVSNPYDRDFALEQYTAWYSSNATVANEKKARIEFVD